MGIPFPFAGALLPFPGPVPFTTNQHSEVQRIRVRLIVEETHTDDGGPGLSADFSIDEEWTFERGFTPESPPTAGEFTLSEGGDHANDWNLATGEAERTLADTFSLHDDGSTETRDLLLRPSLERIAGALPGGEADRPTAASPNGLFWLRLALEYSGTLGNWDLNSQPFELHLPFGPMHAIQSAESSPVLITDTGTDDWTYLGAGTITATRDWSVEVEFLGPA